VIAQAVNMMNCLNGPEQFIIPIYQRTYSWTLNECAQLWEDIIKTSSNDEVVGHFVGSVVFVHWKCRNLCPRSCEETSDENS
jgi:hypothetical protein